MKHAAIFHGTDSDPSHSWMPWMRQQLEENGYDVWAPKLPNNHEPDREVYNDFLFSEGPNFSDSLLVGHSSGTTAILNMLEDDRSPHVKAAILVAAFIKINPNIPDDLDNSQFDYLFPSDGFDWEKLKQKCGKFYFVHGDDDPYCPYEWAVDVCKKLGGELITIPGGHHVGGASGITQLPQVVSALRRDQIL